MYNSYETYMLPKNYIVHLQKLWWILSIRMSTSASEYEISYASVRRWNIICQHQKIKACAYAEAWWTDLRLTYSKLWSRPKQYHQHLRSVRISQSQLTRLIDNGTVHSRHFITNGCIPRQRSSQYGKNVMGIEMV